MHDDNAGYVSDAETVLRSTQSAYKRVWALRQSAQATVEEMDAEVARLERMVRDAQRLYSEALIARSRALQEQCHATMRRAMVVYTDALDHRGGTAA
jgi:uncharacterized sporulation protein YeaH/YhbH (DUF444 family)